MHWPELSKDSKDQLKIDRYSLKIALPTKAKTCTCHSRFVGQRSTLSETNIARENGMVWETTFILALGLWSGANLYSFKEEQSGKGAKRPVVLPFLREELRLSPSFNSWGHIVPTRTMYYCWWLDFQQISWDVPKNPANHGISYQPQLVTSVGFLPSTVWRGNPSN